MHTQGYYGVFVRKSVRPTDCVFDYTWKWRNTSTLAELGTEAIDSVGHGKFSETTTLPQTVVACCSHWHRCAQSYEMIWFCGFIEYFLGQAIEGVSWHIFPSRPPMRGLESCNTLSQYRMPRILKGPFSKWARISTGALNILQLDS